MTVKKPPYHFVPVSSQLLKAEVSKSKRLDYSQQYDDHFSGELLCELQTLTPAIFGSFQRSVSTDLAETIKESAKVTVPKEKKVIIPNFYTDKQGQNRCLIAGSSIKGMVRNNLAAISASPMQRVQEKSFSYRPNISFLPKGEEKEARYKSFAASISRNDDELWVEVYPNLATAEIKSRHENGCKKFEHRSHIDHKGYLSQLFAKQNGKKSPKVKHEAFVKYHSLERKKELQIPVNIIEQFSYTTEHLCCDVSGHLSSANPMMKEELLNRLGITKEDIKKSIRQNRTIENWPIGMLIYVEAKMDEFGQISEIISFGNNFRYYWSFTTNTTHHIDFKQKPVIRKKRPQVDLLNSEKTEIKPSELNLVRSVFGFTETDEESQETDKYAGKVSFNHALEVIDDTPSVFDQNLFTALKQSGAPKPSSYEFYVKQFPAIDKAPKYLQTYGEQQDSDNISSRAGELAGRKFYWHQEGINKSWIYDQSTGVTTPPRLAPLDVEDKNASLAHFITPKSKTYRFSVRFNSMSRFEMGALLLSLSPNLFYGAMNKVQSEVLLKLKNKFEYPLASKLGHGRPQGFGSVSVNIVHSKLVNDAQKLEQEALVAEYLDELFSRARASKEKGLKGPDPEIQLQAMLRYWLSLCEVVPGLLAEYPKVGNEIFNFHQEVRSFQGKNRKRQTALDSNEFKLPSAFRT